MFKIFASPLLCAVALLLGFATSDVAVAAGKAHKHENHGHDGHNHAGHGKHDASGHVSEAEGMRAVHAWTRAAHKGEDALVFVELQNRSDHAFLFKGGHSSKARLVELVGFSMKDGNAIYVPLSEMPIAAGGEMVLAPRSLAIRLKGLKQDLSKGKTFEMGLDFTLGDKAIDIHVNVEVGDVNASQHSHAGHMH